MMQRIWIIGCSGSGKSTLARRLADQLQLPRHELDAIFHQPGWAQMPDDEFRRRLDAIVATDQWVLDGNYFIRSDGAPARRADMVVWLDLTRGQTMRRVIRRTIRRVLTREELWNGNREPWSNLYRLDPAKNIIVWTWQQHPVYRQRYSSAIEAGEFGDAAIVRLRSAAAADAWLASVAPA